VKQVAERTGKLLTGGEPDMNNVCKSIIMDWQRGNIPYFTRPPKFDKETGEWVMGSSIVNFAVEEEKEEGLDQEEKKDDEMEKDEEEKEQE